MYIQLEECKGLSVVKDSGSFGITKSGLHKGERIYIKYFTPETLARLIPEFIVSYLLSQALKDIDNAPEFPTYRLVRNQEGKIVGFSSTKVFEPTNIQDFASRPEFYRYLATPGCATHAAMRFFAADPDSASNHGWDQEPGEEIITCIDLGLSFYKELALEGKLEEAEQGKLPASDVFAITQQNLLLWLLAPAQDAEQFSPFHAFDSNPRKHLYPKDATEMAVLKKFYQQYLEALKMISNNVSKLVLELRNNLPIVLMNAANKTFERINKRTRALRLMLDDVNTVELINSLPPIVPVEKAFFDSRRSASAHAFKPLSEPKENLDPQRQRIEAGY